MGTISLVTGVSSACVKSSESDTPTPSLSNSLCVSGSSPTGVDGPLLGGGALRPELCPGLGGEPSKETLLLYGSQPGAHTRNPGGGTDMGGGPGGTLSKEDLGGGPRRDRLGTAGTGAGNIGNVGDSLIS